MKKRGLLRISLFFIVASQQLHSTISAEMMLGYGMRASIVCFLGYCSYKDTAAAFEHIKENKKWSPEDKASIKKRVIGLNVIFPAVALGLCWFGTRGEQEFPLVSFKRMVPTVLGLAGCIGGCLGFGLGWREAGIIDTKTYNTATALCLLACVQAHLPQYLFKLNR